MSKIHYDEFLQDQIDLVLSKAALTQTQKKIFEQLLKNHLLDEGIAMELGMSRAAYYRHKKILQNKIRKVLTLWYFKKMNLILFWYFFKTPKKKGLAPKGKAEIKSQISTTVEIMILNTNPYPHNNNDKYLA